MSNSKQQTDPLEYPLDVLDKLCAAINEANDAFCVYAKAWGVDVKGATYFGVTENNEIQAAISEKRHQFCADGLTALLLAATPAAGGKPQ
jgi:hypothetical protein